MTMQSDVLSAHAEATGTMVTGRTRLKGYQCLSGGTEGAVVVRDGGPSGPVRLTFNISTSLVAFGLPIPGQGILFNDSIHVTIPAASKITIFYG